jgi:predicted nucleic acid-binding protein
MNIYVETNFVLELAFVQEQHESCEQIIGWCEAGSTTLVLPAFCIAESYETLIRRATRRTQIANDLLKELRQLSRSRPYKDDIEAFQSITGLLARSLQEEDQRLIAVLERVLKIADIIPLESQIFLNATQHRVMYKLEPQDSIVYSSVLHHLVSEGEAESCFINKDRKDFYDPDIDESLTDKGCKMLFSFIDGSNYVQHCINTALGS